MSKQKDLINEYFIYTSTGNNCITAIDNETDVTFIFLHINLLNGREMLYIKPKKVISEMLLFTNNTRIIFNK